MYATKDIEMEYPIGSTVIINNKEWRIAEYRMHGGRKWMYTLAYEETDGSYRIMNLNERAIKAIEM